MYISEGRKIIRVNYIARLRSFLSSFGETCEKIILNNERLTRDQTKIFLQIILYAIE